jgi:hypothetical protein
MLAHYGHDLSVECRTKRHNKGSLRSISLTSLIMYEGDIWLRCRAVERLTWKETKEAEKVYETIA